MATLTFKNSRGELIDIPTVPACQIARLLLLQVSFLTS